MIRVFCLAYAYESNYELVHLVAQYSSNDDVHGITSLKCMSMPAIATVVHYDILAS